MGKHIDYLKDYPNSGKFQHVLRDKVKEMQNLLDSTHNANNPQLKNQLKEKIESINVMLGNYDAFFTELINTLSISLEKDFETGMRKMAQMESVCEFTEIFVTILNMFMTLMQEREIEENYSTPNCIVQSILNKNELIIVTDSCGHIDYISENIDANMHCADEIKGELKIITDDHIDSILMPMLTTTEEAIQLALTNKRSYHGFVKLFVGAIPCQITEERLRNNLVMYNIRLTTLLQN